jgi:hypothetical protein
MRSRLHREQRPTYSSRSRQGYRLCDRVMKGQASPQEILDTQQRFDNHFLNSPIWQEARTNSRK